MSEPAKILFVCLGNICRSPTAEGVFRKLVAERGWQDRFEIDSAGTGSWHVGHPPDERMTRAAHSAGYTLEGQARAVRTEDFSDFDHIFAMDASNLETLRQRAPQEEHAKIRLFRDADPEGPGLDVPDPYYGGPEGFVEVVRIVERTSKALVEELGGIRP